MNRYFIQELPTSITREKPEYHYPARLTGWYCERCEMATLSRCLRCDAACCGTCLVRHECEA